MCFSIFINPLQMFMGKYFYDIISVFPLPIWRTISFLDYSESSTPLTFEDTVVSTRIVRVLGLRAERARRVSAVFCLPMGGPKVWVGLRGKGKVVPFTESLVIEPCHGLYKFKASVVLKGPQKQQQVSNGHPSQVWFFRKTLVIAQAAFLTAQWNTTLELKLIDLKKMKKCDLEDRISRWIHSRHFYLPWVNHVPEIT